MDENTVFQGNVPSASSPPQPSSVPVQNVTPQPIGQIPVQPSVVQGAQMPPIQPLVSPSQPMSPPPQPVMPVQNIAPQPVGQVPLQTPSEQIIQPVVTQPLPPPSQQIQQPIAVQNVTPQPIGQPIQAGTIAPTQPLPVQPKPPSSPPPIGSSASHSGSRSFMPTGGIIKAIIGLVILVVLGFFVFGVLIPMLFSDKNEKVTLTYWGLWEDPNIMQKIIDDFQRQNPNIIVKYERQDIKPNYRQLLLARIANGKGPDIFQFHNSWVPEVKNVVTPLPTDVISPDEFKKAYYPVVSNDLIRNGAIYGVPLQIDTLALFTNTDLLQASSIEPPSNWEDFGRDARALTVKDEEGKIKTAGAALGTYDNITHAPDILSLLFIQSGANIYDLSSTSEQSLDALNYYILDYSLGESNVWDTTLDTSLVAFTKGNLAMYFGYSWDIFAIQAMNPSLHFQVSPVPHLALGKKVTVASYWVEGVSQKTKHQKQAMLFMKYLTKKETLEKLYTEAAKTRSFGQLYPRPDLAETLKGKALIYPFMNQANNAVSSFFVSDTYDNGLNDRSNAYLGDAIRSMLDTTSAESALETLSAGVSQVLKDYGL